MRRHLPYWINVPPIQYHSQIDWYSIYLPRRDRRRRWPVWWWLLKACPHCRRKVRLSHL